MLDIEAILQQFELIEEKVEHVIQARRQLQQENEALNRRIEQLEETIREKTETEKQHTDLTLRVREKIDSLIGRLEGIPEE